MYILFSFFRKRSDKQSSPICAKVLASEPAAANTQVDKNYAQNQYLYRENGTVVRRGLPCEVGIRFTVFTENTRINMPEKKKTCRARFY